MAPEKQKKNEPQLININTGSEQKEKKNWWKYAALISAALLFFIFIGDEAPVIDFRWLVVLGIAAMAYYLIKKYLEKEYDLSLYEMIDLIEKEERKHRGESMDFSPENVYAEPLGKDMWAVRFEDVDRTYIVNGNKVKGASIKHISELQQDITKSEVWSILAQKGITEEL